ncbi:MAG: hypothetical protein ABJF11_03505 [Reichenbachiella sp.]|uniref:hypothetical protein n=1 Tax=Reichenbachiella sp. TaxID=2184521 RepID=UPI0032648494
MLYSSTNLDIKLNLELGEHVIEFVFKEHFTREASQKGAEIWKSIFDRNPTIQYILVWNCEAMSGFDPGARKEWYQCIKLYKNRIDLIHVVARHLIIRGAAKVMLEVFGIKSNMVRSYDELLELA